MYYGKPSPFAKWWSENITQMAVSQEIRELLARAFEGGQIAATEEIRTLTNEQIDEVIAELRKKSMDPKRWVDVYAVAIETIIQLREELKEAKNK